MKYDYQQDLVYGYKDGMGLLMDVFIPTTNRNGAAVISVRNGSFRSRVGNNPIDIAQRSRVKCLLDAGYVVFAVALSSSPKYRFDEIIPDISRAVRFIRYHAERFGINPYRIGIRGHSSGAFLSLMAATAPPTADPEDEDPVDRVSSHVQAVAANCSPTDLLHFGDQNTTCIDHVHSQLGHRPPWSDFHSWCEETQRFERILNPEETKAILRKCSPINHTSVDTPPMLLLYGDKDEAIPIQQAELLVAHLEELGVPHKLIIAKGEGHDWEPSESELKEISGWFDQYLYCREASVNA